MACLLLVGVYWRANRARLASKATQLLRHDTQQQPAASYVAAASAATAAACSEAYGESAMVCTRVLAVVMACLLLVGIYWRANRARLGSKATQLLRHDTQQQPAASYVAAASAATAAACSEAYDESAIVCTRVLAMVMACLLLVGVYWRANRARLGSKATQLLRHDTQQQPAASYVAAASAASAAACSEAYGESAIVCTRVLAVVMACLLLVGVYWRANRARLGSKATQLLRHDTQQQPAASYVAAASAASAAACSEAYDGVDSTSITCAAFPAHVDRLRADSDAGFAAEYQALDSYSSSFEKSPTELTCIYSMLPENKTKNRYINIVAYDHTRVILRSLAGVPNSDYINANFVDGYHRRRAYITTQGPLPSTFADFWRMVWEQRTMVIVMITNMVEKGRKKCDQYWPSVEGVAESYGTGAAVSVRLLNQYPTAFYTVRVFSLKSLKVLPRSAERLVFHYHYTHWPDHGVPFSPLPVLAFVRKATEHQPEGADAGPIVVHCSAGVGRSGTFIVIDSMLRQMTDRGSVNPFAFLAHVRRQRNFLVQTEEQYVFCHEVLLEAIRSGRTEVAGVDLRTYVDQLLPQLDAIVGKTLLRLQYECISSEGALSRQEALSEVNRAKNVDVCLVPTDAHRVTLTAEAPAVPGSDYINASFMPGFHKLDEFILTQWPLQTTVRDFWRMIWEYNCQTIVLLCAEDLSAGRQRFWPSYDVTSTGLRRQSSCSVDYGSFLVRTTDEAASVDNRLRLVDLQMESQSDDFQLPCRLVQCADWPPTPECPSNRSRASESTWDLVHTVQECYLEYQNGPVVVVDGRGGGREAGLFCALTALACQLEQDQAVDVYRTAKILHQRRPGLFTSCQDYAYLYGCLTVLVEAVQNSDKNSHQRQNSSRYATDVEQQPISQVEDEEEEEVSAFWPDDEDTTAADEDAQSTEQNSHSAHNSHFAQLMHGRSVSTTHQHQTGAVTTSPRPQGGSASSRLRMRTSGSAPSALRNLTSSFMRQCQQRRWQRQNGAAPVQSAAKEVTL